MLVRRFILTVGRWAATSLQGLIEGSLVEILAPKVSSSHVNHINSSAAPQLKMFFRTSTGCAFVTDSTDGGLTWGAATPMNLPNPNTKLHVIQLQPSGDLAVAFNDHARNQFCKVRPAEFREACVRLGLPHCRSSRCLSTRSQWWRPRMTQVEGRWPEGSYFLLSREEQRASGVSL